MMTRRDHEEFALRIAPAAAAVANYCDHVEHNEGAERAWVTDAGALLRSASVAFAAGAGADPIELFAERLGAIEARNVLYRPGGFDGHAAALQARTWRDLQLLQVEHDRAYHPDVIGLTKADQLRHYALHLAKIVGAFAEAADHEDLLRRRLPDALLFGLKLPTVMGARLPDEVLPRLRDPYAASSSS
jgi:hypothetical protein